MKSALLLIDIQNDYFSGGRCELFKPEQAAEKARMLLELFRNSGLPVIHIQHIGSQSATFFLQGSEGAEIYYAVSPKNDEKVLVKHAPNAFLNTGLYDLLKVQGIELLIICGMMSHMCIDTTVRAAKDLGFHVLLPEDACTTKALSWDGVNIPAQTVHQTFMASLNGLFAKVLKTEELIKQHQSYSF